MKKISTFFVMLSLYVILFGCTDDIDDCYETANYNIVNETYNLPIFSPDDVINFSYPQIRGLGDDSKEYAINELLKNHVFDSFPVDRLSGRPYGVDVLDMNVVYHVTMASAELLSIVYEYDSRFFHNGRNSDSWRNARDASAITIDIETATILQLSDFTPTNLPEEYPGLDIYYRIIQSRELLFFGSNEDNQSQRDYWLSNEEQLVTFLMSSKSYEYVHRERSYPHCFFVTLDSLYYISRSTTSGGSYLFSKILDEAEPYEHEFPKG